MQRGNVDFVDDSWCMLFPYMRDDTYISSRVEQQRLWKVILGLRSEPYLIFSSRRVEWLRPFMNRFDAVVSSVTMTYLLRAGCLVAGDVFSSRVVS